MGLFLSARKTGVPVFEVSVNERIGRSHTDRHYNSNQYADEIIFMSCKFDKNKVHIWKLCLKRMVFHTKESMA